MMLEEISEFTIASKWARKTFSGKSDWRDISLDVAVPGIEEPVVKIARRSRQGLFDALAGVDELDQEYTVYTGPGLDSAVGKITPNAAYDLAGDRIGFVKSKSARVGSLGMIHEFHQNDLGVLIGKPVGVGAKFMSRPGMKMIPFAEIAGTVVDMAGFSVSFRGDSSPGFDVTRNGPRGVCHFTIHDPKISRLLVFCSYLTLS
jgi:hypothetical protein